MTVALPIRTYAIARHAAAPRPDLAAAIARMRPADHEELLADARAATHGFRAPTAADLPRGPLSVTRRRR